MDIYMMRHGETAMNIERLLQGRLDTHLNEKGRDDAALAGKFLQEKGLSPDIIWTSPLVRAKETAEIATGIDRSEFVVEPLLIEMSFGKYEGRCVKDKTDPFNRDFFASPDTCLLPDDAETFPQLIERAGELLDKLIRFEDETYANEKATDKNKTENDQEKKESQKTILLTSHGAFLHAILANINNTPIHNFWDQKFKNCEIIHLIRKDDKYIKAEIFFPGFDRGGLG
jgi:alpha-ribazole phosphatase/probable phosphoglycerate mutase